MIKVFEAFAGIGTQRMALERLGIEHEVVAISEIDKHAVKSYEAIHGPVNNLGDITRIEVEDIPEHDLFTYSFPCFTKDNLVLTEDGYKPINEVTVGDKVLTHNNTYEEVVKTFDNGVQPTVKVKAMGIDEIVTTPNHKFYVRKKYREWNNEKRSYDRMFKEPQWKEIKDVTKDYFLGMAVNQKSEIPKWNGITFRWGDGRKPRHKNELQELMDNQDFWWIVGRYLADGWTRTQGGIVFGIGKNKAIEFENRLGKLFNYSKVEEKTVVKYHVPLKELSKFVEQFGKGADNKRLSKPVLNLPADLLESFLDGYFSGDGSFVNGYWKANSVSRELMLGIGQAVMKVYKRPYSLHKDIRPKTAVIEGRTVNQKDTYSLSFKKEVKKQDNAFYENGYVWIPFNTIEDVGDENVYDIEVDNAHSFTVQNIIVHNCQDISIAGNQRSLAKDSDTRSSLIWECERIIFNKRPKYLLMENVKNLVSKRHIEHFNNWLHVLESYGYKSYWKIVNAKHHGIPQNRERVFCISIYGEHEPYEFPREIPLEITLTDLLQDEFDEKYLVSEKTLRMLLKEDTGKFPRRKRFIDNISKDNGIANSLLTRQKLAPSDNFIKIKNATKKGYLEGTYGDGVDLSYPNSEQRRGRVQKGMSQTLTTKSDKGVIVCGNNVSINGFNFKLRRLTPLECWRLMGIHDSAFDKAQASGVSETQLYKQAGNAIVVDVLEALFRNLFSESRAKDKR